MQTNFGYIDPPFFSLATDRGIRSKRTSLWSSCKKASRIYFSRDKIRETLRGARSSRERSGVRLSRRELRGQLRCLPWLYFFLSFPGVRVRAIMNTDVVRVKPTSQTFRYTQRPETTIKRAHRWHERSRVRKRSFRRVRFPWIVIFEFTGKRVKEGGARARSLELLSCYSGNWNVEG